MKIIIFESPTDSLKTFANLIAEGFLQANYEVLMADMQNEVQTRNKVTAFTEPGRTAALFFNHTGLNLLTAGHDDILWNQLDVDCYDLIVDHPMYYHAAIMFPVRRLTFLCVDQYHQKFIERFYPGRVKSIFFPHAGIKADADIPFEERSMDILFTGAYLIDNDVDCHTQGLESNMKQLWLECFEMLKSHTFLTLEQAVERCFRKRGLLLPDDDLRDVVRLFQDMDGMLRSHVRANVIKTLADNDIQVHVYGEGWEYLNCRQENLTIHGRIPFDATIPLMADARIVLNIMPWFKAGVHDRVYTAMLNHSVCLTDSSEYMDKFLEDGKNALLFHLQHLEELPDKLRFYLSHPEKLKEIAQQGYHDAENTQTWQYRAVQLINIIESNAM